MQEKLIPPEKGGQGTSQKRQYLNKGLRVGEAGV
jgi:hypothetical protein